MAGQRTKGEPTIFCLYEGPLDTKNYWQSFRLAAEDLNTMHFYQTFHNSSKSNNFTCFDKDYEHRTVSISECADYKALQDFILFKFIFTVPQALTYQLYYAAKLQKQPLLVYVRDGFSAELGEADDDEPLPGQKELIDFNLYKGYKRLLEHQESKRVELERLEDAANLTVSEMTKSKREHFEKINRNIVFCYGDL